MIIHAVTNDLLADIPVDNIARFEKELYAYVNMHYPQIGKKILEAGDFTQELTNAINEFKTKFVIEA
jgi:F-type H+-transporting ATPase subunit alpha